MPRRFYRRPALRTFLFIAAAIGLLIWAVARNASWAPEGEREQLAAFGGQTDVLLRPGPCQIVRVIDAATIVVRQKDETNPEITRLFRIRLIGVKTPSADSPAMKTADAQATAALKDIAAASSGAVIELDKRRVAADGSWLAYVYSGEVYSGGTLLNAEVIRTGARMFDNYPGDNASMARRLGQAQDEARRAKRGVWSEQ